ncbi:hypothetical protein OIDMADRAFT_158009 [Oidiodendron maius Zn]|uniref:Xylanolytic transcriptional activator regulatory domain-containing protein n=1 Tax=Oidiodendron maius (strain Zn) TaxID=913774 RepID=A0A0C3DTI3_OIDMZ|nr:hypothetical protein OIDMADRAFT_158009 [Oidiodendron maius Zn]
MSSHLAAGRLSIVNLLYNEDAALPPSRPKTPVIPSTDVPASSNISQSLEADFCDTARDHASEPSRIRFKDSQRIYNTPNLSEKNVERKLIQVFFNNLHHLHPFLLVDEFMSRCEREVWSGNSKTEPQQNRKHFIALYNIVIAVGALIAGIGLLPEPETELNSSSRDSSKTQQTSSSIMLSVIYFRKSRVLLGDVFEVCSLESAQTLFLMSLYCQNSLKPHSCYMYSGMAVRTALAIGMPSESMSKSIVARKAARRTWWCIYSHEIDMCSSAGRRDSLRKPESYVIPFPKIKVRALELDEELTSWRRNLPSWLNLDSNAFREPEWASKQKLVLQLRYLNARILIHRPFLASVASQNVERLEANIDPCIDAARKTITLMYDSYAHRYYFRTWWYNSTYTLYAGMILLYIILLNYNKISGTELLRDVEKSHEILLSMKEASVARRSADLMLEVIEIAKTYLARRRLSMQQPAGSHLSSSQFGSLGMEPEMNVPNISMSENNDWQRTLFADDFLGLRRVDMLSTLIDPTILVDFAAENTYSAQNDPFLISGDPDTLGMWASPQ